jgi:hypothetical protein
MNETDIYTEMVTALRAGDRWSRAAIESTLAATDRTCADLVDDVLTAAAPPPWRSGDPCPHCGEGRIRVTSTKRRGELHVQYLACNTCRKRPPRYQHVVYGRAIRSRHRKDSAYDSPNGHDKGAGPV